MKMERLIQQICVIITAALILIASLAWNDFARALCNRYCPDKTPSIFFLYAILTTLAAVAIICVIIEHDFAISSTAIPQKVDR